ncbi:G-protein coupled receptor 4-like isoform X3 [Poeciliopsis prolifica]|uniref:G-protein coupled receptor 4-like isoform X3 n=1 Tax=Poeciliopsis prolifica TaxID=188132 RepID=UPI0024143CCF|nr:G-protein coupled receptor 4-like isoform X3 [Poeciliopsis prolifica]XP_054880703.1 G-protein coupled receptor 4-like isoform X3 [Poeciliopsis prolifica]XP_054880704.1 G-protein coupled receptor 4-like isoform X3 [Poeciliopsis prolifica]
MEEMNSNMTEENSFNNSYLDDNSTLFNYNPRSDSTFWLNLLKFLHLLNQITIGIGFLLILVVMIAVFSQVRKGQDAPVYVINLLVSDIIQLCCRIPADFTRPGKNNVTYMVIADLGVMVSVGFMVCISFERYLVIAKPLWYRFRRNIKTYVVVCIVVWSLPLFYLLLGNGIKEYMMADIFFIIIFVLPFPFFIFFLVGTIKALSAALGVPEDEKRRIVAIQVAVLIIYSLLYLPIISLLLGVYGVLNSKSHVNSYITALVCVFLSPLADTTLYLFTRKSILDKFLASICFCKISTILETISTDHESWTETNTEAV